jgi:DNA-binding XRE family transcriptional regulator
MAGASSRSRMSAKQRVERLRRLLQERFHGARIDVDAPSRSKGDWFIDTRIGNQSFVIQFRPSLGFGLSSTPSEGIDQGPDEFLDNEEAIVNRVNQLFRAKGITKPQRVRLLQELRERLQVSQVAVADKLGIRQPTISKIERREDVNLSTLRRYVRALGGKLHITAEFVDGSVEIGPGSERSELLR